jgi:SAM-dependent methyltransferase/glycosyltransferase involved in cell wall biosynthesis
MVQLIPPQQAPGCEAGPAMMRGRDIVCVSVMDWDWPFWTSRQQLMSRFAGSNRVLFVDPPLTFARDYLGSRSDARLRRKLTSWARNGGVSQRGDNLFVWSPPPVVPFNRIGSGPLFQGLLSLNQALFRASLKKTLERQRFCDPILWVSFNVYFGDAVVGRLGESLSVYHCTDEVSGFPGYSPQIREIEARLASRCDLVLTTSEVLRESKARYNPRSYFIPNAADVELFQKAARWTGSLPEDLASLPEPRAGFIGQVEYRFDYDLLRDAALQMPDWSFALIGPVQENREVEKLRGLPNVHFLGLKGRDELPGYLSLLQVTLIPYKINQLTRGIYPLKLQEYLAAGKPVVATPLPSLVGMDDLLYLANSGDAFVDALRRALAEDGEERRAVRMESARGQSWEARAADISVVLEKRLAEKRSEEMVSGVEAGERGSLPLLSFLRLGRELSLRHGAGAKRMAYRFLGDLNIHRRVRAAHVLRELMGLRGAEVEILDAGCGEGACAVAIAGELPGCHVTGVDIDPASVRACLRMARRLPRNGVSFELADATMLPFVDRFDAAVCVDVLEHVQRDEKLLGSILRALKPGGRLVLHVPMRHQLQRRFLPTHNGHHVSDHVRDEYTKEEITEKVRAAGFRLDDFVTTFGAAGELAFELNTLFTRAPAVREIFAAMTYPLALLLGYLDVAWSGRGAGNSFLIVARRPAESGIPLRPSAGDDLQGRDE